MTVILRLTEPLSGYRVRIVEACQPLAARPVKCQRVIQSMGFLWRHGHPRHDKADPVAALRIHNEHLPVQVEQHIERRIAQRLNIVMLSHYHNLFKPAVYFTPPPRQEAPAVNANLDLYPEREKELAPKRGQS